MISEVIDNSMEWYGLTRDIRDQDLDALKNITSINSLTAFLNDFSDTAAAIMNMDFIISVDTAVAHLAGALGKPVWILLPFHSDFRWLRDREESPWYPTARLFRQTKIGDWSDVLERISKELDKLGING
jgi:ADP-heptose:LPS heptosyltransferase